MLILAFAWILACSPLSLLSEQGNQVATKAADVASKAQEVTAGANQTGAEAVSTTAAAEQPEPAATKSTAGKASATDTPEPEASGPVTRNGKIGQRLVGESVALTVVKAELNKGTSDVEPDPGNTFLLVHLIVENTSKTDRADLYPDYFQVKDGSGRLIDYSNLGFLDDEFEGGRFSPGGKNEGIVGFEVSQKQKGFHLLFEYEDQQFDIDLGL
jgi:hypothetical protein